MFEKIFWMLIWVLMVTTALVAVVAVLCLTLDCPLDQVDWILDAAALAAIMSVAGLMVEAIVGLSIILWKSK